MRDRLIEILQNCSNEPIMLEGLFEWADAIADNLLAEGVIVPPCEVGDYVYYIKGGYYKEPKYCEVSRPCKVVEVSLKLQRKSGAVMRGFITDNGTRYSFDSIGKTVFLNREEAEAALAKRREK